MTNNNGYRDRSHCDPDRNCTRCKPKHPKSCDILLDCGQGTGSQKFTSSDDPPFQIAHVSLNTTCLDKKEILIKFSNLIKTETLSSGATVRLRYELFRLCGNENPIFLGSWMYEEVGVATVVFESQEETFSFIFCECTSFAECCEYFVKVIPVEIINAEATVSTGKIAALSQSVCNSSNDNCRIKDSKHKSITHCSAHPRPSEIILACGQGNGSVVFREATISQPPAEIAHVAVNTSCFSKSNVLIEFSCIINSAFRVQDVRLEFELFRACSDRKPTSLGIWGFERTNTNVPSAIDNAFSFVFCENTPCLGCCEYFVTVNGVELTVGAPGIYLGVTVDNARIVALAQSSEDNSYCNDHRNHDKKNDSTKCLPMSTTPRKILLECGMGTGSKTFTSSIDPAFQLAQTTIDTTCLCNPIVNIEFSSIVSFEKLVDQGRAQLRYELFKSCNNKKPISLGIWIISRIDFRNIDRSTNSFDFTFCDCVTCPGCCNYYVTVTPIEITQGSITAKVSDGRMSVLAQ